MSGAMRLFKVPANFATKNNYPIIEDAGASAARPGDRVAARTDSNDRATVPSRDEHVVTTEFRSLLGGSRRPVTTLT